MSNGQPERNIAKAAAGGSDLEFPGDVTSHAGKGV
jgi:hypothetical protein